MSEVNVPKNNVFWFSVKFFYLEGEGGVVKSRTSYSAKCSNIPYGVVTDKTSTWEMNGKIEIRY